MVPALGILMDALYPNFTSLLRFGGWGELRRGMGSRTDQEREKWDLPAALGVFLSFRRGGGVRKGGCLRMSFRYAQPAPCGVKVLDTGCISFQTKPTFRSRPFAAETSVLVFRVGE